MTAIIIPDHSQETEVLGGEKACLWPPSWEAAELRFRVSWL